LACGEMFLKLDEFYNLTPREFNNILIGYQRKEENQVKLQMQLFRDLEFTVISPYLDSKNPKHPKNKYDYKSFIWEKTEVDNTNRKFKSVAELESMVAKVDKNKK
jgi:hypothetical protein